MRRHEFTITDKAQILTLLHECEYGTLSLIDTEGLPYGVPVNFAWWEEGIAFHGASEGKKMELIAHNPQASFNAIKSYSLIPSYFSGTSSACPATQFFGSVTIAGSIQIIHDLDEKASALNALMEKLQPEKRYETLTSQNPIYTKMLEKTAVLKLIPKSLTCKLKIGQNVSDEKRNALIEQLTQRGDKKDLITIEMMKALRLSHE